MRATSAHEPLTADRWLGAICYLSVLAVLPMLAREKSAFLARHCRQGFALLFAEVVVLLLLAAIDKTIGLIPVLGFLVSILLHLAFFMIFLLLSAVGFVKALSGESWDIPGLDELAERVPIHSHEDEEPRHAGRAGAAGSRAATGLSIPLSEPRTPTMAPPPVRRASPPPPPDSDLKSPGDEDELDEHATSGGDAF